jgi:hypothetical protein
MTKNQFKSALSFVAIILTMESFAISPFSANLTHGADTDSRQPARTGPFRSNLSRYEIFYNILDEFKTHIDHVTYENHATFYHTHNDSYIRTLIRLREEAIHLAIKDRYSGMLKQIQKDWRDAVLSQVKAGLTTRDFVIKKQIIPMELGDARVIRATRDISPERDPHFELELLEPMKLRSRL